MNIVWDTTVQITATRQLEINRTIAAAADYINSLLARAVDFDVHVSVADFTDTTIAVGSSDIAWIEGDTWESVGQSQSRTGVEQVGYDAILTFDTEWVYDLFFGSPENLSLPIPAGATDGFSTVLHEMLHGLGFNGWTDWATYQNTSSAWSPFDEHITVLGGKPYFDGPNVRALMSAAVPLEAGNIFHLSAEAHSNDVMNPYAPAGVRQSLSVLDLAILADLGFGTIRDDILLNTGGSDNIAGGPGRDVFLYNEGSANFIVANGSVATVRHNTGAVDALQGIERVWFSDAKLALDVEVGEVAGAAYRLYQAAFARVPDVAGVSYWIDQLDHGMPLHDVANGFVQSAEFFGLFGGANPSNDVFVARLYENILDRPGESGGVDYWTGQLNSGLADKPSVLMGFSESPENVSKVAGALQDGIWYV